MCLINCIWLGIIYSMNLLARYNFISTQRHYKYITLFSWTIDKSLFYVNGS